MKESKEIAKWFRDEVYYDPDGVSVFAHTRKNDQVQLVLDVRGWGAIQNLFNHNLDKAAKFQDKVGVFIAEAINEKLKGDTQHLTEINQTLRDQIKELNEENGRLKKRCYCESHYKK